MKNGGWICVLAGAFLGLGLVWGIGKEHKCASQALVECAERGDMIGVQRALDHGGDKQWLNRALLRHAICGERIEVANLIHAGADPNYRDGLGQTALHWACLHWDKDMQLTLLVLGANKNIRDNEGNRPSDLGTLYW